MRQEQLEMWPEEVAKGYRLHQHLLAPGERPDMKPWAGIFDRPCGVTDPFFKQCSKLQGHAGLHECTLPQPEEFFED